MPTGDPAAHVIFFGQGEVSDAICDNLVDFLSLGLVKDLTWVNPQNGVDERCIRHYQRSEATGYTVSVSTLAEALRPMTGTVVLCAVDVLDENGRGIAEADSARWLRDIESHLGRGCERIRVIISRLPLPRTAPTVFNSWLNLSLAPEDSECPGAAKQMVFAADDPAAAAEVAAPALAGLFGLWTSMEEIPVLGPTGHVDERRMAGGVRQVRVFHRHADASDVEMRLRDIAIDVSTSLPCPYVGPDHKTVESTAPEEDVDRAAQNFIHAHASELIHERIPAESPVPTKVKAWTAIKHFLIYFLKFVISTPREWIASQAGALDRMVARITQNMFYGQDSATVVVCGNQSGRDVSQISRASTEVLQRLDSDGEQHRQVRNQSVLGSVWQSYCQVCLQLADGSDKGQGRLGALRSGNDHVIIPQGRLIVPDVTDSFRGDHRALHDTAGLQRRDMVIRPYDSAAAIHFGQALDYTCNQTNDRALAAMRQDFRTWFEAKQKSFSWKIGAALGGFLSRAQQEAAQSQNWFLQLQEQLKEPFNPEAGFDKANKKLWFLKIEWIITILISIYLLLCHHFESWRLFSWLTGWNWKWAVLAIVISTVINFVIGFVIFNRALQAMNRKIDERKLLVRNADIAMDNFKSAVRDVNVLSIGYGQFLCWNKILGRVIAEPFGRVSDRYVSRDVPQEGLPRSTKIGRVTITDDALRDVSHHVRSRLFEPNWADNSLAELDQLARTKLARRDGSALPPLYQLFGEYGRDSGSALERISEMAVDDEVANTDRLSEKWLRTLEDPAVAQRIRTALSQIVYYEDNRERWLSAQDFFSPLEQMAGAESAFSNQSVNPEGINAGANQINREDSVQISTRLGQRRRATLSDAATLVEFSEPTDVRFLGQLSFGLGEPSAGVARGWQADGRSAQDDGGASELPDFDSFM